MNKIPFRPWPVKHKAVSSGLRYARPRFHRLFRPSPPDEHDHTSCSDPAGWLPMNTTTTQFLRSDPAMYTSPGRTYGRVGVRDPARMYVHGRIFFLAHWPLYIRVHATCAPLLRHVRVSTSTSMYVHVRDQNDNAMYASTKWVPTVTHFLACEDVGGGSQQSGGANHFSPDALPCVQRCSSWVPAVRGKCFFRKIRWPVRWVPTVRWRNNYFACNKEALAWGCRGPSCQPLDVQPFLKKVQVQI